MRVLILGGTSLHGRSLVERLLAEGGHEITLFTRGTNKPLEEEFAKRGVQFIHGDREKHAEFKATFDVVRDGYDVILDNTSMNGADVMSALDTFKGKTGHYILCSSVAVYPDWNRPAPYREEEADLDCISVPSEDHTGVKKWIASYANGKRSAEKALITHAEGLPYTILRPAVIEGPHDHTERTWYWLQRMQQGVPVIVTKELTISQHAFVEDVANFALAVIKGVPRNRAYNVAGDDALRLEAYLTLMHSMLPAGADGSPPKPLSFVHIDRAVIDNKMSSFPPFFDYSLCVDNTAAKADYGFTPTKITDWLPATIRWELENCRVPEGAGESYVAELSPFLASSAEAATATGTEASAAAGGGEAK